MACKLLTALILTVCACHFIQARKIVGSESCTLGPSYWCQSFQTAAECGARYHCMEHVWNKNPRGFCSGYLCDICEEYVENYLNTSLSKIENNIKNALKQFCGKETKILRGLCKHLVTHDLMPYVIKFLKTMTPKKICTILNICSDKKLTLDELEDILASGAVTKEKLLMGLNNIVAPGAVRDTKLNGLLGSQHNAADSLSCITCSIVVSKLDAALGNKNTEGKIVAEVDRICQYLPGKLSNECQSYVKQFGPPILQALLQYLPAKQICAYYIHACPKSILQNEVQVVAAPARLASSTCVVCEIAVRIAEEYLKINKTEDRILSELLMLCDTEHPAGPSREVCNGNLKLIASLLHRLNKDLSPSNVCQFLHLCKKSEMAPKQLDVCRLGPNFWCTTKGIATMCKKSKYCGYQ